MRVCLVGLVVVASASRTELPVRVTNTGEVISKGRIGETEIDLSLDFLGYATAVWVGRACPPFIAPCFAVPEHFSGTLALRIGGIDMVASSFFRLVDNPAAPFTHASKAGPVEGAGFVGLGKGGDNLLNGRILSFRETVDSGFTVATVDYSSLSASITTFSSESEGTWEMQPEFVHISGIEMDTSTQLVIQPGLESILLPKSFEKYILERFGEYATDHANRLLLPCDPETKLFTDLVELRIGFRGFQVVIPASELTYPASEFIPTPGFYGRRLCPTRLVIIKHNHMRIGRHLIRAVEELLFDYGTNQIGIVPKALQSITDFGSFPSVQSSVPLFEFPVIENVDSDTQRIVSRARAESLTGWALLNTLPLQSRQGELCWTFKQVDGPNGHLVRERGPSHTLPHRFTNLVPNIQESHISWTLNRANTSLRHRYIGSIRQISDMVEICFEPRNPSFSLPGITRAESVEEDAVCSICCSGFPDGCLTQPTGVCTHLFHSGCMNTHVDTGGMSCPNCRAAFKEF
jgi:hypothetical protein